MSHPGDRYLLSSGLLQSSKVFTVSSSMPLPHPLLPCILSILQSSFPLSGGTAPSCLLTPHLSEEKILHPAFQLKDSKSEHSE